MSIEGLQSPQPLPELLQDGRVFWVAGGDIGEPQDSQARQLWICGAPATYGRYPTEQAPGYRVDWTPVHSGWKRYLDTYTALGSIQLDESNPDSIVYGHLMAHVVPDPTDSMGSKLTYFMQVMVNPDEAYLRPWVESAP